MKKLQSIRNVLKNLYAGIMVAGGVSLVTTGVNFFELIPVYGLSKLSVLVTLIGSLTTVLGVQVLAKGHEVFHR